MAGSVYRDPAGDHHLLTPQNAAIFVVDYQPSQIAAVKSMDRDLMLENIVSTVKTAKAFGLPIIHSTINVASGRGQPTVPKLAELLADNPPIDIGGTSEEAHRAGLERVVQAGGHPISWVALAVELQRDWAREETVADVIEIVLTDKLLKE